MATEIEHGVMAVTHYSSNALRIALDAIDTTEADEDLAAEGEAA